MNDAQLLTDEAAYCSFGDTVHYVDPPKIFTRCEGSYLFDSAGVPYLDLQMWYSAVNFGYANPRLNDAAKRQLDTLPQVASQYLHPTKIELAKRIAEDAWRKCGQEGPRALQRRRLAVDRGLAQARAQRARRQKPDVRLRGRLPRAHARRLGHHLELPLSAPLRPLRRARAVRTVPVSLPWPEGDQQGGIRRAVRAAVRPPVRDRIQRRLGSEGRASASTPPSTSNRCRAPAATSSRRRTSSPG